LSEWIFEVLETMSHATPYEEVLKKESDFILKHNAIES